MTLHYRYRLVSVPRPVVSLGGRFVRPRPLVPVTLIGPGGSYVSHALLDSGGDDTVFGQHVAARLGIDLTNAPTCTAAGLGLVPSLLRLAEVVLRLSNGHEQREWKAWVGFTQARLHYPVLGFAGCLRFFEARFLGHLEDVELSVNPLYPGT